MKVVMTLFFILLTLVLSAQLQKSKTIVGVFAHPDDENMIGDVLAKYARLGNKVYVIIATDLFVSAGFSLQCLII